MHIHGLNKTTLLDYPEHVACTIFTGNCNFRCPFCQNGELVLRPDTQPEISEEEILSFLRKRKNTLEGICITGGEPTLQADLKDFIVKIKELGYLVKLDSNGSRPELLQMLYEEHLIDFIAMDIKSGKSQYSKASGLTSMSQSVQDQLLHAVDTSVKYIMQCGIDYEFRTTVVKGLHVAEDFDEIAEWIQGCKAYYLQSYRDTDTILARMVRQTPGTPAATMTFDSFLPSELNMFCKKLNAAGIPAYVRGV